MVSVIGTIERLGHLYGNGPRTSDFFFHTNTFFWSEFCQIEFFFSQKHSLSNINYPGEIKLCAEISFHIVRFYYRIFWKAHYFMGYFCIEVNEFTNKNKLQGQKH